MDRWQTTVRGETWKAITAAAHAAVYNFFEDAPTRQKVLDGMRLDISPHETYTVRGGDGVVTHYIVEYEATVTVGL